MSQIYSSSRRRKRLIILASEFANEGKTEAARRTLASIIPPLPEWKVNEILERAQQNARPTGDILH